MGLFLLKLAVNSTTMRIAILGAKGIPARSGGIEKHVEELAVRLAKRNFDVTVYTRPWYTGTAKKSHQGVRLVPLASVKTKHFDAISHTFVATLHAIRKGFDVYHFHGVGPSLLAWLPRLFRPSARVIATFHCIDRKHQKWGFPARLALKIGEWAACRFAHDTIVVSKTLAHYCREVYNREAVYIPNGVSAPKPGKNCSRVLHELNLYRGRYVIMVSRLVRHKGVHTLIDAWKKLKDSTGDLSVMGMKLVIVGDGAFTDGYVREIQAKARGMKDVVLAGFRTGDDLKTLLSEAAFAVHPSESEGLPIAVLEEMSYGKAVLASDIPEHLEIIEGKGYRFRSGNVRDLMLQLYWLITHPRDRARMGRIARQYVTAFYRWDDIARETARLYRASRVLRESDKRVKTASAVTLPALRRA